MNHDNFSIVFQKQMERCEEVLGTKNKEYASDADKLHNFRVAADLQGTTEREALGGMMAKHVVSIYDLIQRDTLAPMEVWDEKITDTMNYLILLKAIVIEERNGGIKGKWSVLSADDSKDAPCRICPSCYKEAISLYVCCPRHTVNEEKAVCWTCISNFHEGHAYGKKVYDYVPTEVKDNQDGNFLRPHENRRNEVDT